MTGTASSPNFSFLFSDIVWHVLTFHVKRVETIKPIEIRYRVRAPRERNENHTDFSSTPITEQNRIQ